MLTGIAGCCMIAADAADAGVASNSETLSAGDWCSAAVEATGRPSVVVHRGPGAASKQHVAVAFHGELRGQVCQHSGSLETGRKRVARDAYDEKNRLPRVSEEPRKPEVYQASARSPV